VVEEEAVVEPEIPLVDTLQDYSEETRGIYSGGLSEDTGDEAMAAEEV
jgi:hypothetical protein